MSVAGASILRNAARRAGRDFCGREMAAAIAFAAAGLALIAIWTATCILLRRGCPCAPQRETRRRLDVLRVGLMGHLWAPQ